MEKNEELLELLERVSEYIEAGGKPVERFDELALEVSGFQAARNPAYRRFAGGPEMVRKARHWSGIPAVVTSAFKEGEWTALAEAERVAVFHSSGTTARERSRHFHSRATLKLYEQSLLAWFKPFVLPDLERAEFMLLSPRPEEAPHSSLVHMFATVARALGGGTFHAAADRDGGWRLDLGSIAGRRAAGPVTICGTAFSFVQLCDGLEGTGRKLRFPAGSRVFETGGYKGRSRAVPKAELHQMISRTLDIPEENITCEYGMSELSSQAYDRRTGSGAPRLFRFPPWARARIIDPETGREAREGETGLIRVFDLANVSSVMAVQTEDLGVRRGDGFELLGRAAEVEARGCSLLPA